MAFLKTGPWILFLSLSLVGVSHAQGTFSCSPDFLNQFLAQSNFYRGQHNVAYLSLDNQLSGFAQNWANQLLAKNQDNLVVIPNPNNQLYGENLYGYWSSAGTLPKGDAPVNNWYKGAAIYAQRGYYGREPNMADFQLFGAFTQLVWAASQKVGVGCAGNGKVFYVVANYNPGGNYDGQFAANVNPPTPLVASRSAELPADAKPASVPLVTLDEPKKTDSPAAPAAPAAPVPPPAAVPSLQLPAAIVQVPQPAVPAAPLVPQVIPLDPKVPAADAPAAPPAAPIQNPTLPLPDAPPAAPPAPPAAPAKA